MRLRSVNDAIAKGVTDDVRRTLVKRHGVPRLSLYWRLFWGMFEFGLGQAFEDAVRDEICGR